MKQKKHKTYAWLKRHTNYGERFYGQYLQNALRRERPELFVGESTEADATIDPTALPSPAEIYEADGLELVGALDA